MDYEKKYKEALALARLYYDKDSMNAFLDTIFPELRDSEDERIRKNLIVEVQSWEGIPESKRREYIAYLEKQKDLKK